jgi:hypothetical protein
MVSRDKSGCVDGDAHVSAGAGVRCRAIWGCGIVSVAGFWKRGIPESGDAAMKTHSGCQRVGIMSQVEYETTTTLGRLGAMDVYSAGSMVLAMAKS